MRSIVAIFLLFALGEQQMVAPKVKKETHVVPAETYETVTRSCPDGYEGHFVDTEIGFGSERYSLGWSAGSFSSSGQGFTVCFDKKFMDEIRKNHDLLANRPPFPRPA
jgi:hypothetical protein